MEATSETDPRASPPRARGLGLALALGAVAAALVAGATAEFGPSGWHFAVNNIAAAEGLLDGRGMVTSRGEPFVLWPPLYPLLLAAAKALGAGFLATARALAVLSAFAIVALQTRLVERWTGSRWLAAASGALLVVSPVFLDLAVSIRSQPLLIALMLWGITALNRYLEKPGAGRFAALAACCALASLHRYDGLFVVGSIAALIAFLPGAAERGKRLRDAALLAVIGSAPVVAWFVRNRLVASSVSGERMPSVLGLAEQNAEALRAFSQWIAPWAPPGPWRAAAAFALGAVAIAGLALRLRRRPELARETVAYVVVGIAYGGALIVLASFVEMDPLGERLLVPLLPFVLALVVAGLDELHRRLGRAAGVATVAFVLAHAIHGGRQVAEDVARMRAEGAGGFAKRAWAQSEISRWLREHPLEGELYSNLPEAVLLAADRTPTYIGKDRPLDPADTRAPAWLIWIQHPRQLAELRERLPLEPLVELEDGAVFRIVGPAR